MESSSSGIKTWQWIVTVIVIIILVILGYTMFKGSPAPTDQTDTNDTTLIDSDINEVNRVVVADQFPGNIVYISSVQLAKPGFVVIKNDKSGTPGDVIGSQYFDKGINPGKVNLTKATVNGGMYYAQIYADDGDKKFDATKDLPVKDSAGKDIMRLFKVSTSITEIKG